MQKKKNLSFFVRIYFISHLTQIKNEYIMRCWNSRDKNINIYIFQGNLRLGGVFSLK